MLIRYQSPIARCHSVTLLKYQVLLKIRVRFRCKRRVTRDQTACKFSLSSILAFALEVTRSSSTSTSTRSLMMLGIGIDILSITRLEGLIARRGAQALARRICCNREYEEFGKIKVHHHLKYLSARYVCCLHTPPWLSRTIPIG